MFHRVQEQMCVCLDAGMHNVHVCACLHTVCADVRESDACVSVCVCVCVCVCVREHAAPSARRWWPVIEPLRGEAADKFKLFV